MRTDWLHSPYYNPGGAFNNYPPAVKPADMSLAEWDLLINIFNDLEGCKTPGKFLSPEPGSEYTDATAYTNAKINYAYDLTQKQGAAVVAPPNWDFAGAAVHYVAQAFEILKHIRVQDGDENSADVYTAWIYGWGQLYGGHPEGVVPPVPEFRTA